MSNIEVKPQEIKLDKWKIFDLVGYECRHENVRRFHNSEAKTKVVRAPARSSKSFSAAHDVLDTCLLPNKVIWIVGPSYALAEKEFRYIHDALVVKRERLGLPKPLSCLVNHRAGSLFIRFPWGTIVEGKSAERPDSLLGEQVDRVIYSEGSQLPSRIRDQFVYPRLMTTRGKEIIPTTPSMGGEWVDELYDIGIHENDLDIEAFTWPITANPSYSMEEFELARRRYGEDSPYFREQFLGESVVYSGLVYPQFRESVHVIEPFDIPLNWPRYRAIDFGHRDPFVCLWAAVGPEQELYFYREYYTREGAPIKQHAQMIQELSRRENITMTVADYENKQAREDLAYYGIPNFEAIKDRHAGRLRVAEYLLPTPEGSLPWNKRDGSIKREKNPRCYFFNTMKETIREFKYFRWKEKSDKQIEREKEKTEGEDHAMDPVRYLCMARPSPFRNLNRTPRNSFNWHINRTRQESALQQYSLG